MESRLFRVRRGNARATEYSRHVILCSSEYLVSLLFLEIPTFRKTGVIMIGIMERSEKRGKRPT